MELTADETFREVVGKLTKKEVKFFYGWLHKQSYHLPCCFKKVAI